MFLLSSRICAYTAEQHDVSFKNYVILVNANNFRGLMQT